MKRIIYIFIIFIILLTTYSFAEEEASTDEIIEKQEESFGIKEFLKESNKYTSEVTKEINVTELFKAAVEGNIDNTNIIKKIAQKITPQITDVLKIFVNIIVIILIHSLLKSITDDLENKEISKLVFYVQYILIVTVIISGMTEIIKDIEDSIEKLIGFSQSIIPLLVTLMVYTGNVTTSTVIEPVLLFLIEIISNCIKNLVLPIISIITVLVVLSKITDKVQIDRLSKFMKSSIIWFLGILLTCFIGVVSIEGNLTSSVDGVVAKTTKAAVSSLIPVVRKDFR